MPLSGGVGSKIDRRSVLLISSRALGYPEVVRATFLVLPVLYTSSVSPLSQVVRELEGLVPGQGPFARDRQYQKGLADKQRGTTPPEGAKNEELSKGSLSDASDVEENDEESRRILETGGRDRCAYFFWQGERKLLSY